MKTDTDCENPRPVALVVEDDDLIADLLKLLLVRAGYDVAVMADGSAARQYIDNQPAPAVALFDVMVPLHDGLQLVRQLRQKPGWEGLPVLMLTSRSGESDIVGALEAGANDYIVKPFLPNELLARVRRFVQLAGA